MLDLLKQGWQNPVFDMDWTLVNISIIFIQCEVPNQSDTISCRNDTIIRRVPRIDFKICTITGSGDMYAHFIIPSASTKFKRGILVSPCPSVDRIVSALYLQQYTPDPFHICTSYQATSGGVSRIQFVSKFKNLWNFSKLFKFITLTLSSFNLGSNMIQ